VVIGTAVAELVYFAMAPVSPIGWWFEVVGCQIRVQYVADCADYWLVRRLTPQPKTGPGRRLRNAGKVVLDIEAWAQPLACKRVKIRICPLALVWPNIALYRS